MEEFRNNNTILSYSVVLERKTHINNKNSKNRKVKPLGEVFPRKMMTWVKDDAVSSCYQCKKRFSWLLRKHHCRLCGRIFCYQCSDHWNKIPQELLDPVYNYKSIWEKYIGPYTTNPQELQRLCQHCHATVEEVQKVKKNIIFISKLDLNLKDYSFMSTISSEWYRSINYLLSVFREIQYRLPFQKLKPLEKKLLRNNKKFIPGHNRLVVKLIEITNWNNKEDADSTLKIMTGQKTCNCWNLMCSRDCYPTLKSFDIIEILSKAELRKVIVLKKKLMNLLICTDRELKCYLPILVNWIREENEEDNIISNFLIKKSVHSIIIRNFVYWELMHQYQGGNIHHKLVYDEVLGRFKKEVLNRMKIEDVSMLLSGSQFIELIQKVYGDIANNIEIKEIEKKYTSNQRDLSVPVNPLVVIQNIDIPKIKIKRSATKPIILPCQVSSKRNMVNDDYIQNKKYQIMFKKENLRKDQMICNIITLMDLIIKTEIGIDCHIVNYQVLPINQKAGLIEIVSESETIYYIRQKMKMSILNYIMENNHQDTVSVVRDRFMKSTAAYCVITYLLGIGDRHLDNIMVTKSGKLFHIDYDFVMGKDPKYIDPIMRITPEIVEAIGGESSAKYQEFKNLCTVIFNCLRRYVNLFYVMLNSLPEIDPHSNISYRRINREIAKRFIPGEDHVEANLQLASRIDQGYDKSFSTKFIDLCHYYNRENSVGKVSDHISSSVSTIGSSFYGLFTRGKKD